MRNLFSLSSSFSLFEDGRGKERNYACSSSAAAASEREADTQEAGEGEREREERERERESVREREDVDARERGEGEGERAEERGGMFGELIIAVAFTTPLCRKRLIGKVCSFFLSLSSFSLL